MYRSPRRRRAAWRVAATASPPRASGVTWREAKSGVSGTLAALGGSDFAAPCHAPRRLLARVAARGLLHSALSCLGSGGVLNRPDRALRCLILNRGIIATSQCLLAPTHPDHARRVQRDTGSRAIPPDDTSVSRADSRRCTGGARTTQKPPCRQRSDDSANASPQHPRHVRGFCRSRRPARAPTAARSGTN